MFPTAEETRNITKPSKKNKIRSMEDGYDKAFHKICINELDRIKGLIADATDKGKKKIDISIQQNYQIIYQKLWTRFDAYYYNQTGSINKLFYVGNTHDDTFDIFEKLNGIKIFNPSVLKLRFWDPDAEIQNFSIQIDSIGKRIFDFLTKKGYTVIFRLDDKMSDGVGFEIIW
jgi:hypothetical protein